MKRKKIQGYERKEARLVAKEKVCSYFIINVNGHAEDFVGEEVPGIRCVERMKL